MPEFKIDWKMPCAFTTDEKNRPIWKLRLNDQWSIACIVSIKPGRTITIWTVESIEIHRKNTAGKFSIHGILTFREFQQNISHVILTGASTVEISSSVNIKIPPYRYANLYGFVNISDISEKQASGLANRELKEAIQLKSIGELSNDLERLLDPGTSFFSDVTLKCSGTSIPAHKTILSSRSPVFAAMFAHPMKESIKSEVNITDIDEPVLRHLLMYLYTGKTSDLSFSSAADLLLAADKYQLQDLKSVCCYFLKKSVSFKTVWKMLVLGDLLCEDLKSFAIDCICFMCGKISVLESRKEWKVLEIERPDLALEVMESFPMDDICNTCDKIAALESAEGWKARLKEMPDSVCEFSNDLERLLDPESSCFADVALKCASASIPAHKIILSARSPVFAATFANLMKESLINEVDITDVDEPVLRHLLMYLYTGKTTDLTFSSAADLLLAADKYQLKDLKMVCAYFLKETVSFKTVWRMLVLGDLLFEDLKSFAIDYICNTCGEVSVLESTEEWKALREERPDLALEVSKSFAMDHICNTCGKITAVESAEEWKVQRKVRPNLALEYSGLLKFI